MRAIIEPSFLKGTITAPPSKSYAHRLLIAAALADGPTFIEGKTDADDIKATISCLRTLGTEINESAEGYEVIPIKEVKSAELDCNESGSTLRFLLPVAAALGSSSTFAGKGRLPERPMKNLVSVLNSHSRTVTESYPYKVVGKLSSGKYVINGGGSSQYVTGLLYALTLPEGESEIEITGKLASRNYVDITADVLKSFGAKIKKTETGYVVKGAKLRSPGKAAIEGDWSGAAFFIAAGAIDGDIEIAGLKRDSIQGDREIADILKRSGAKIAYKDGLLKIKKSRLEGIRDAADGHPDIVPALAAAAACIDLNKTEISGVSRLKDKESDRLTALIKLAESFAISADVDKDILTVRGGKPKGCAPECYHDHRIVMAAAVIAASAAGLTVINGAEAVNKSYPAFFEDFKKLGGKVEFIKEESLNLEIYGSSHGEKVGMRLSGVPAGEKIDIEALQAFADRRKSRAAVWSTARGEPDKIIVNSGIIDGMTDGGTIEAEILNTTARSSDYDAIKYTPRPSHADYPAFVKYGGKLDMAGGGIFSGRMTAPLVIAGGLAEQILKRRGITISAYITEIEGIKGVSFYDREPDTDELEGLKSKDFPVLNGSDYVKMIEAIDNARAELDSVGGVVECVALGVPAGLGEPLRGSIESKLSALLFSIPAVKGAEFGIGFQISKMRGSAANDRYFFQEKTVKTYTNFNGGIVGGLATGMPIIFRAAIKPTPSIGKIQETVDLLKRENTTIEIKGRHDSCVVPRAVPAVESALAITILDYLLEK
jgi:chorismate synthase/3-phosphoshikimate 1-carboxyvinyltransferase